MRKDVNEYLTSIESSPLTGGILALNLLKRPNVSFREIAKFIDELKDIELDDSAVEEIEVIAKYEGYITKQIKEAANMQAMVQ